MVKMRIKLLPTRRIHSYSSIDHLTSGLKSAFRWKELDNFVPNSNRWWRGRSYVPSVASDIPGPVKDRKRVPIEKRRAMIESFVHKYKASNTGKFPSLATTFKEVGGSYYVVRKIIQELQNESSLSYLKGRSKKSFQETEIKSNGSLTEESLNVSGKHLEAASELQKSSCAENTLSAADDVSHSVLPMRSNLLEDSEDIISSHKKPYDDDKKFDISQQVSTESHALKNERDVVSDVHLESRTSEELKHEEGPYGKEQQVQSSPELHRVNIKTRTVDEAQHTAIESKPWGERIKSIVDGIFNMWRKR
ncbi:hypothetical protein IC582_027750 [Cucumis melo]|uniref:Uncharacterized protein LOC103497179 isoform X2 n=2 Tax=Cucumis melo TaxID=3656 RepID=A0A1S3C592_CUCME|nr:uncharacterized protein LOC103497179 isoform X2 [Cucumis melo]XP_050936370.1 uncharacterized protein LOC103497179 isoform X2 [Cucumis melo]KAA0033854.1 uncharacterized protein E6C27_scaffold43059G00300 [Cucumis melo var. makuwa]TYK01236.1 uncharacterized protein E5676_scaffold49G00160 [Cucumis melo var. makuwa]